MKTYQITNKDVAYYDSCITVYPNATKDDIDGALSDVEMDISIDWGDNWSPASWEALHFDYQSPDTKEIGTTSLVGYIDLKRFCKESNVSLVYTDAWGIKQDKIPIIICVKVVEREEED